jgi:hypothetical protein
MNPLLKELEKVMADGVEAVLSGKKKTFKTPLPIYPRLLQNYMAKHHKDFEMGEQDTNGWQYDWWLPFSKDGVTYKGFGCGYDAGFEFYKDED